MLRYRILHDESGEMVYEVDAVGMELLYHPILNKGSAFTREERALFHLEGLLPASVSTLEEQCARGYENYRQKGSDLERYIYLRSLQDRNEVLFYTLLMSHLDEMMRVVYTPTVGLACQRYSHIFRFARGIFLSPENISRADAIFRALPYRTVEMIVATDSEGILGIGDQGVGGMGIPIGKLTLYTAGAGINPAHCLPVTLDVGTNNQTLLNDPLYLGIRRPRLRGEEYFAFVEHFVQAVRRNFPEALLQWEDFSKENAFILMERYRDLLPSFNDDIQGTGAVVLSGICNALKISGSRFADQVFVIVGAGAAGIGIARQIRTALIEEGLSPAAAEARIWVLDILGLLVEGREGIEAYKRPFIRPRAEFPESADPGRGPGLTEVVRRAQATVLLGCSGAPGIFTEEVVRALLAHCPQPLIFPLSNPTSQAEAQPADIYRWSGGRAIVATGSPFPDVTVGESTFRVGQGNNVFIFPGIGLGALAVRARTITDEMFTAAATRLAELVPEALLARRCVYPEVAALREVTREIAIQVAAMAIAQKVARRPVLPDFLAETVTGRMWVPRYARFTRGSEARTIE